jgi:hypothetical protein
MWFGRHHEEWKNETAMFGVDPTALGSRKWTFGTVHALPFTLCMHQSPLSISRRLQVEMWRWRWEDFLSRRFESARLSFIHISFVSFSLNQHLISTVTRYTYHWIWNIFTFTRGNIRPKSQWPITVFGVVYLTFSVGIATGCGLDGQNLIPARWKDTVLHSL